MSVEDWKRAAAEVAAKLVRDGMLVGLGSGTTVAQIVRNLARLKPKANFIPSSFAIQKLSDELGLKLGSLDVDVRFDLMLDGADEVDASFSLIKGRGGAHTREKIIASAARRIVIVVDRTKLVRRLGERMPVPVEVLPFAHEYTIRQLAKLGGEPKLRVSSSGAPFVTDNGNYIIDVKFRQISRPAQLEREINRLPGVVENGLFIGIADEVLVGHELGHTRLRSREDFLRFARKWKC